MPDSSTAIDPRTPVIIGVGQFTDRLGDPDYRAYGEADLAAEAVRRALADTGVEPATIAAEVDTIAATRSFEISSPASQPPLGRPDNMPRAIAKRVGMEPHRAVQEVAGGQSPQHLVTEFSGAIAAGEADLVVLCGAEAISTVRHFLGKPKEERPDFTEQVGGQLEDRGYGIGGLTSIVEVKHGLVTPPPQYALLENARRSRLGLGRQAYRQSMAELFAPFSEVAAANPYSAAPVARTPEELITTTESNRIVADPYNRMLVARDQVNQAAAVVLASAATADALGVAPEQRVYLHGHSDLVEVPMMARPDLSRNPSAEAATRAALDQAGISIADISVMDIYSCFPIAVSNFCDAFGLAPDDPRGLTVTGGLPYFGGAGNNYSMHAIAEIVERVRRAPGSYGLVVANGGVLSKASIGIYATDPAPWRPADDAARQAQLDAVPQVPRRRYADGPGVIEAYTVLPKADGQRTALVIGRMADDGERFLATVKADDEELLALLEGDGDPVGHTVSVQSTPQRNWVSLTRAARLERLPEPTVGFRDDYEHILVHRDGHLLEVTINRPDARNALNPAANGELDEIFTAYFADPELRVAILTGAGDAAFCSGNDLTTGSPEAALAIPKNGFAGLTSRPELPKPVIAAVNGYALGGGLEIAMACHLVVADENASFGLPEVKVGLAAAAGGLVRLPLAVGPAWAHDMLLTGRRIDAATAAQQGLVSRIAEPGKVMELAREVAGEILAGSPSAVRASVAAIARGRREPDPVKAVVESADVLDDILVSRDLLVGIMAFLTKQTPDWPGN